MLLQPDFSEVGMAVKEKRKLPGLEIYLLIKKKMHLQQLKWGAEF